MVVIRTSLGSAAVCSVEVGDFVKYVSQLPSCSDLTNNRHILRVTNARESCAFQIDFVLPKIRSSFVIFAKK